MEQTCTTITTFVPSGHVRVIIGKVIGRTATTSAINTLRIVIVTCRLVRCTTVAVAAASTTTATGSHIIMNPTCFQVSVVAHLTASAAWIIGITTGCRPTSTTGSCCANTMYVALTSLSAASSNVTARTSNCGCCTICTRTATDTDCNSVIARRAGNMLTGIRTATAASTSSRIGI